MTTLIAFHDVDDVAHWLRSTRRTEMFARLGVSVRTFVDPYGSTRTGLILEVPDMVAFNTLMGSPDVIDAMQDDGVHPDSLVVLSEV